MSMWRQGDIMIAATEQLPSRAQKQAHLILARGEVTGHSHRVADKETATLFSLADQLFLQVIAAEATIIHEEHGPITLPQGIYRIWQQREYTPKQIRRVID
ncbi:MAG TPA: hypothetical protein VLL52_09160 [Anaerolineae bacterium]|nr:hypothetical protein [Anaerolineae bacterium]